MSDRCDSEVYEKGTQVFLTHTIEAKNIEKWVQAVAKLSEQKVDWHYFGGRAVILALGKINKVNEALKNLRHMHDEMFRQAFVKYIKDVEQADQQLKGIWHYNGLE